MGVFLENVVTFFHGKYLIMMILNLICLFCLLRNRTVPDLPPKNYFGRFSKEVVDARQQGLQDFLIEWVVKEIKIHFTESIFVWTKGYCSFSRNNFLRYSSVVCIHKLDLLNHTTSFFQCPVLVHLAPILQRLDSTFRPINCSPMDKYSLLKTNFVLSSGLNPFYMGTQIS